MIRLFASSKQRLLKSTRTELATTSDHISMAPGIYIKNNITVRRETSSKVRLEVSGRENVANYISYKDPQPQAEKMTVIKKTSTKKI
jgi:hypothetical protein